MMRSTNHKMKVSSVWNRLRKVWSGYAVAVVSVLALTAGLRLLDKWLPLGDFPITYIFAVMAIAYLFGEGPALLTFVTGWIAFTHLFVPPAGIWPLADTPTGYASHAAFIVGSLVIGSVTVMVRRSRRRAQRLLERVEAELADRKRLEHEREQAVHELQDMSHRLSFHVDNSPLGVVEWDEDFRLVRWTGGAERIFGWQAGEVLGKRIDEIGLVHDEDWVSVEVLLSGMVEGTSAGNVNHNRNRRKDGSVIYCEWYNSVQTDDQGQLVSVLSMALDITERVEAQCALETQVHLLQQALLPEEPSIGEGFQVSTAYIPAYEGDGIGGDFYDVFRTEDAKVGILIGDVSGKGIPSAAMAASTRSTVRAFAYDELSPGKALAHANAVLTKQNADFGHFVTVFLAILDPESGSLAYSGAGHPPAAIRRHDGSVDWLYSSDLPIGIHHPQEYVESETVLCPGDRILLYTDGISEARHSGEMFGEEGIERVLTEHGSVPIGVLVDELLAAARAWGMGRLKDDTAVVAVERETE